MNETHDKRHSEQCWRHCPTQSYHRRYLNHAVPLGASSVPVSQAGATHWQGWFIPQLKLGLRQTGSSSTKKLAWVPSNRFESYLLCLRELGISWNGCSDRITLCPPSGWQLDSPAILAQNRKRQPPNLLNKVFQHVWSPWYDVLGASRSLLLGCLWASVMKCGLCFKLLPFFVGYEYYPFDWI